MNLVGVDEVGRGPIAGPVAVGAFMFIDPKVKKIFKGVKESKQLNHEERLKWLKKIVQEKKKGTVNFAVTLVSEKVIDNKGLSFAIKKAITTSLNKLNLNPVKTKVLLDGGLKAPIEYCNQKTIIKGDEKEMIIALASIAAKVQRDVRMIKFKQLYSNYCFDEHKGYGTKAHYAEISKYGLTPIHRRSFLKNL